MPFASKSRTLDFRKQKTFNQKKTSKNDSYCPVVQFPFLGYFNNFTNETYGPKVSKWSIFSLNGSHTLGPEAIERDERQDLIEEPFDMFDIHKILYRTKRL